MRFPVAILLSGTLFALAGCQRSTPPKFTPSQEVLALIDEAESEEDKNLWEALQTQISTVLDERFGTPLNPKLLSDPDLDPQRLKLGAAVYHRRCVQCHGVNGDGKGAVAEHLYPLPRDYRKGIFKFTSTPYGARPRRSDLVRTLKKGVLGTSMPAFDRLPNEDLKAVVDYVMVLSQRGELESELVVVAADEAELTDELIEESVEKVVSKWKDAESQLVQPVTMMPEMTEETIEKGRDIFLAQACTKCHGKDGRGGFFGNVEVGQDIWGNKTAAADLTSGMFHGGGRPIDIYRRIYSGINGSPMPRFAGTFQASPDDIWYMVHFVKDLSERRRRGLPPKDFAQATTAAGDDASKNGAAADDDGEATAKGGDKATDAGDADQPTEDGEVTKDDGDEPKKSGEPADESDKPADAGDKPTDEGDTPADEGDTPADESDKPADAGDKPTDDADNATADADKPKDGADAPVADGEPTVDTDTPDEDKSKDNGDKTKGTSDTSTDDEKAPKDGAEPATDDASSQDKAAAEGRQDEKSNNDEEQDDKES